MSFLEQIDIQKIPKHVAIVMDGNGRWAKEQGRERIFGHLSGVESVRSSLKAARRIGIQYLTLYAFSTENWNRPRHEVEALMNLLVQTIVGEIDELDSNEVRLSAIGDISSLPEACQKELLKGINRTSHHKKITLVLALSYSSRQELVHAIQRMLEEHIDPGLVNADLVSNYLSTQGIPDPELLIRTSGEKRISNFLLWQIAYAELYFTETFWPDFNEEEFYKAIVDYQARERRFGKTSEQISSINP